MDTTNARESDEGRETARKYADIIHGSRPAPRRPGMDLVQRAKIFTPYDALRGFDEAIDEVDERVELVDREELSEEQKGALSDLLLQVKKGMHVQVRYFVPEVSPDRGRYADLSGTVLGIDPAGRTLSLREDREDSDTAGGSSGSAAGRASGEEPLEKTPPVLIRFDDLLQITSSAFRDIDVFLGTGPDPE